ncbi:IMPACT family protein [Mucilaginibacter sp. HMF5004]|uniref:IMPACT family protein n=1 Tax=Mucilaginibacter rivuli TaxID=2857527 RepID=UPI001C5F9581|nr:YigZ family protein [Mucilaginibacter rivuli]MBW4891643.1 IMPACT family protein [Mucilaginibacter rivuli]
MLFEDTYRTIAEPAKGEFKDRGSKFMAFAYPIASEADIKPILNKLRAEHSKANHHCWAMRLSPDRSIFRVNDDGEPSGTASRPILNTLLSHNLTNVLVVVVRYFGGTLLGVPGLINAYKTAVEGAIKSATVIEKVVCDMYSIQFEYALMNEVMRVIKQENLEVLKQMMEDGCEVHVGVRKSAVERVVPVLQNINGVKLSWVG